MTIFGSAVVASQPFCDFRQIGFLAVHQVTDAVYPRATVDHGPDLRQHDSNRCQELPPQLDGWRMTQIWLLVKCAFYAAFCKRTNSAIGQVQESISKKMGRIYWLVIEMTHRGRRQRNPQPGILVRSRCLGTNTERGSPHFQSDRDSDFCAEP